MFTIHASAPDEGLYKGIKLLQEQGKLRESRNGTTVELGPVTFVWHNPENRVSFCPIRNANPFFHINEIVWILSGRNDVGSIAKFNKNITNYSDNGKTFHGAYGARIGTQLRTVIDMLNEDPETRRAVVQIWDWGRDLNVASLDIPCNTMLYFKIRDGALDMTVMCRSNDLVWGATGANVVHFSAIMEIVARTVGVKLGRYYQISDSLHAYIDGRPGKLYRKLVGEMKPPELTNHIVDDGGLVPIGFDTLENAEWGIGSRWLNGVLLPLNCAFEEYRENDDLEEAIKKAESCQDVAWRIAAVSWLERVHLRRLARNLP